MNRFRVGILALVVALPCILACGESSPGGDAGQDTTTQSFDQPVGAPCVASESVLCARGLGVCRTDVCYAFCSAVDLPHCPGGMIEVHEMIADRQVCLCMPPAQVTRDG